MAQPLRCSYICTELAEFARFNLGSTHHSQEFEMEAQSLKDNPPLPLLNKPYIAPKLTFHGTISSLTAAGSDGNPENGNSDGTRRS